MGIVLIGGGARSGKSRFALEWAGREFERPVFLATAEAGDEEMRERIERHRRARGSRWRTVEEPLELASALQRLNNDGADGVVVDCLTLWLSNVFLRDQQQTEGAIGELTRLLREWNGPPLLLITNEVGCGIVPDNALARRFRDWAGLMNEHVAAAAAEVYWMVFGCALRVKPGAIGRRA